MRPSETVSYSTARHPGVEHPSHLNPNVQFPSNSRSSLDHNVLKFQFLLRLRFDLFDNRGQIRNVLYCKASVLKPSSCGDVVYTSSGLVCCSFGRSWWAMEAFLRSVLANIIYRGIFKTNYEPGRLVGDGRRGHKPLWGGDAWARVGQSQTLRGSDHPLYSRIIIST
jgi:hypothetical protein